MTYPPTVLLSNTLHAGLWELKNEYHTSDPLHACVYILCSHSVVSHELSPPQRLLFFKKPRKRGKGGKKGKAEKAREKGKSEESLCQISVEIWRPPGGWLCTAMPACWAVEQRILKMAFLNFNNLNK